MKEFCTVCGGRTILRLVPEEIRPASFPSRACKNCVGTLKAQAKEKAS